MHDYSIDKHPKEKIIFFLAVIAVFITPKIQPLFQSIANYFGIYPGWVLVVPITFVFGLFYYLFDNRFWKCRFLRKYLLVPDLNGTWQCEGKSIIKNGKPADIGWNGVIKISQSWSKISIVFVGSDSQSMSIAASLFHEHGLGYRLFYQYSNIPKANKAELFTHKGSVELLFDENISTAEGHYFTDQHRSTVGLMNLRKKADIT